MQENTYQVSVWHAAGCGATDDDERKIDVELSADNRDHAIAKAGQLIPGPREIVMVTATEIR